MKNLKFSEAIGKISFYNELILLLCLIIKRKLFKFIEYIEQQNKISKKINQ